MPAYNIIRHPSPGVYHQIGRPAGDPINPDWLLPKYMQPAPAPTPQAYQGPTSYNANPTNPGDAIPNPYLPQPTGNQTTPQTTAPNPTANIDNSPVNPTANLSGGISPQGQYNPAGGTFVNPSGGAQSRRRSATNYFNRNWFGGNIV